MTELHEKPTSEWEHSHAVQEGDTLVFYDGEEFEERWEIAAVDDELVRARRLPVDHRDDNWQGSDEMASWPHDGLAEQLDQGEAKRESDDLSHELAAF